MAPGHFPIPIQCNGVSDEDESQDAGVCVRRPSWRGLTCASRIGPKSAGCLRSGAERRGASQPLINPLAGQIATDPLRRDAAGVNCRACFFSLYSLSRGRHIWVRSWPALSVRTERKISASDEMDFDQLCHSLAPVECAHPGPRGRGFPSIFRGCLSGRRLVSTWGDCRSTPWQSGRQPRQSRVSQTDASPCSQESG